MKKIFIFVAFILAVSNPVHSQFVRIPKDFKPDSIQDFSQYEPKVLECINWLMITPIDSFKEARKSISKFIIDWGKATPTVLFFPYTKVSDMIYRERNEPYGLEIFVCYYSGMIKFMIENPEADDLIIVQHAGIIHLVEFYNNNSEMMSHSLAMSIYTRLVKNGMLDEWIRKRLKRTEIKKFYNSQKNKTIRKSQSLKESRYPDNRGNLILMI